MFEDLRSAWRQAVDNFRAGLEGIEPGVVSGHVNAMRRDVEKARSLLGRLEADLASASREASQEQAAMADCRRREQLARGAGDAETAGIAADYAVRHERRAEVLLRKVEVLSAERDLRAEELASMEATFSEALRLAAELPSDDEIDVRRDSEFRDLEREAREREVDRRLEELKRRGSL